MIRVIITCGDINGIGPEIAVKLFSKILKKNIKHQIIFVCPENVFKLYYKLTSASFPFQIVSDDQFSKSKLNLITLPDCKIHFGKATAQSGKTAYNSIIKSLEMLRSRKADVLITAPISKEAFNLAKINFPGHTELLASFENSSKYMMLFLSRNLKAGLVTIHNPIRSVASLLTKQKLQQSIETIYKTAINDFGISRPKIAVLGLNPHAGENGLIGDEEIKIINPVIKSLKNKFNLAGPFVPDAFWGSKTYKKFDMVLGMYHDQILIPFKLLNFNIGVNFTAGLNLIRTSPDHGTAFDIAGKNIADESSMFEAYKYAIKIYNSRNKALG